MPVRVSTHAVIRTDGVGVIRRATEQGGAALSLYLTARIQRFGGYATDKIDLMPEPFDAHLELDPAAVATEEEQRHSPLSAFRTRGNPVGDDFYCGARKR